MIAHLRGRVTEATAEKDTLRVVIDLNGLGYEVLMTRSSEARLPMNETITLYVSESTTAFDGATTLYGFLSKDERDYFVHLRTHVDGMGPKKALETLEKISKSLPDFKRAVMDDDQRLLVSVFGFTKKTAEKLIFSLKGKLDAWSIVGTPKWTEAPKAPAEAEAVSGLLNMGYREEDARDVVAKAKERLGEEADTTALLTEALRRMGTKLA